MTHELDPARTELLARLRVLPRYQGQNETLLARRIGRMTDHRVATVLAMADEEIEEMSKPDPAPQYAPATDPTPVILWNHIDGG